MRIQKKVEHAQCMQLIKLGFNQKAISEKLGISENSISTWIKNSPQRKAQKAQSKLLDRLSGKESLSSEDVAKLTDAISKLQKIIES